MSAITVKVQVGAGQSITDAAEQSARLATIIQCDVEFSFNGFVAWARPGDSAERIIDAYRKYCFGPKSSAMS